MKRRGAFVPPRLLQPAAKQPATAPAAAPAAAPAQLSAFDCTFSSQHKKKGASFDGTLLLRGSRAQLFDLQLREKGSGSLPAPTAAALHRSHAAAAGAGASPLGPLWQGDEEGLDRIVVDLWVVEIEDTRAAAVTEAEWVLRQRVVAEAAGGGKPTSSSVAGAAIPLDNPGARLMAGMGWQPGRGLGRAPGARVEPILPQLKWDRGGLGSSTHVKRLGRQGTAFRRATAAALTGTAGTAAAGGAAAAGPAAQAKVQHEQAPAQQQGSAEE